VKVKKEHKVDWAQITFNSLWSELDRWCKYVEDNKGGEERYLSICLGIGKTLLVSICASKGESIETIDQDLKNWGRDVENIVK